MKSVRPSPCQDARARPVPLEGRAHAWAFPVLGTLLGDLGDSETRKEAPADPRVHPSHVQAPALSPTKQGTSGGGGKGKQ